MKQCAKCKKEKPVDEFSFKIKATGLRHCHCKECARALIKKHYYNNKNYYLKKAKRHNTKYKSEAKRYISNYLLNHSCIDCGESDIEVLEFDHKNNKLKAVASMVGWRYSLNKIKHEIEKCEVRCANCHRRKTAKEFNWFKRNNAALVT